MNRSCQTLLLSLLLLCTFLHPIQAQRRFGACRCPASNFESRFRSSYNVVRAFVLSQWESCHLCPTQRQRKNVIRVYALYTYKTFKGPYPGNIFYAQAFENVDYCGVKLNTGQTYMLNMDDPKSISSASHWTKGWYLLDACQLHYNWNSLSIRQQQFLYARARTSRA